MNEEAAKLLWERDVARAEAKRAKEAQRHAETLLDYAIAAIDAEYRRATARKVEHE